MTTLLLSLLLTPQMAMAMPYENALIPAPERTLRDNAVLRAVDRLGIGTHFGKRNHLIRLGHNVRTRRMSPRRVRQQNLGTVTSVIDGSVIQVELESGDTEIVRTLGSEAPLLLTGSTKDQCFAAEGKQKLEEMILGKQVALEKDRNFHRDNYGRLLRYVRLNSLDVNGWMVSSGYAFSDLRNAHRRMTDYHERQLDARENERGLWGHFCEYNPDLDTIEILQ